MFDADKPIENSEQDRLGRAVFAQYLARSLLDHKNPDSMVIGLMGGLGSGKTSIINLMLRELTYAATNMFDEEKPIILNFSPWSYSGQHQLIYHFFRRLSAEIRQFSFLANRDRIIELLELYVSYFTEKPIPTLLQPPKKLWSYFSKTKHHAMGWSSGRDLTVVKAELNALLCQQKHKLIIIIDNVGRLENAEIKQMFQIIKSMGNFSNTIYLLAFDKARILQAIQTFQSNDPERYLEKIIQLSFDIPSISTAALENILLDRLKNIIAFAVQDTWDANDWTDLYYACLKGFFTTLRDIVRYVNTLGFSFRYVRDVVNPVDFFALTALEVFEPKVYLGIRDNKDLFTDLIDAVYKVDPTHLGKDKIRCDEILNRAEKISSLELQKLLMQMFPRLRHVYDSSTLFYHSESMARKNLRICSPDVFDVYFRLSLPLGYIPESEINAILALTSDEQAFTEALLRLNQENRAAQFLVLLGSGEMTKISNQALPNVINALIETLDLFPVGESNALTLDTQQRAHRIIHQILRRFKTTEQRCQILQTAIKKAVKSIYSIIHELEAQSQEHIETEDVFIPLEYRDLTPVQLNQLKILAVEKIKWWASIGRLGEHPRLLDILYAWRKWGNPVECRAFVEQLAQTDRGILTFLAAALEDAIDEAILKLARGPDWQSYIRFVTDFIDPQILEPHAKALFEDLYFEKLREREQLALMIFLDLIQSDSVKVMPKTTV